MALQTADQLLFPPRNGFLHTPTITTTTTTDEDDLYHNFLAIPQIIKHLRFISDDDTIIKQITDEQAATIQKNVIPRQARPMEEVLEEARAIFSYRFKIDHPRFFSFIPSPASPISWLGDALTSAFNVFAGSWEAGSGVCTVEQALIRWIAAQFGLPASAGGQFVSGGSMANLTGLTVARDHILDEDERHLGVAYISDQAHFCVTKALRIIGFVQKQIRILPTDQHFRMNVQRLQEAITADQAAGLRPFLIVATSGTTNTGSVDPLSEMADLASAHRMWMHVDGAFGASVAFCKSRQSMLQGLGRADSIAWDAHKWLFQTHGCGAVLFRDRNLPLKSFAVTASYVRDIEADLSHTRNPWNFGIELTKPARHMRLWFTLQILGVEMIDQMIQHGFHLAEYTEAQVRQLPDWEILSSASMAIVTFRYAPLDTSETARDRLNSLLSKEVATRNIAAIFTTQLKGQVSLRMCIINPETTEEDILFVVRELNSIACELLSTLV